MQKKKPKNKNPALEAGISLFKWPNPGSGQEGQSRKLPRCFKRGHQVWEPEARGGPRISLGFLQPRQKDPAPKKSRVTSTGRTDHIPGWEDAQQAC